MNKKEKARRKSRNSVFSWNDQSANIRTVTWESKNKINIQLYATKWKTGTGCRTAEKEDVKSVVQPRYERHLRYSLEMKTAEISNEKLRENRCPIARKLILQKFRKVVSQIILLRSVFIRMLQYAIEKGDHQKISIDPRIRLKSPNVDIYSEEKSVLFDPELFKIDYQGYFPKWAKKIANKAPENRTEDELDSLVKIFKQLKEFRRYTPQIQRLMCRVVRYDRFGRHRVVIRKGHVGRKFYIIYSGTVAFTLSEDDSSVFSKPYDYHNLGKGDAFGGLALMGNAQRSATIVCLQATELLFVEKENFLKMGIDDILRKEMEIRVDFLKEYDLFSTWPQHVLQKVAEESRSIQYRNDMVITNNLLQTDMLYVVIKGRCQVLRLLDLTRSKRWLRSRPSQKKRCNLESPESTNSPYSRQGAYSRLSIISNRTGYNEHKIPRTLSQPHPPRNTIKTEDIKPRLLKSAHCVPAQRRENVVKELKRASNYPCSSKSARERSNASNMEFDQPKAGVGVFLCLDVLEKGQSVGLEGILRTHVTLPDSNTDKKHLSLISKGCSIISIPVETVRKHADYRTMKKIQKRINTYPSDATLVDCYMEKAKWNAYKEVLMGEIINDIEKKKIERKPGGSMARGSVPVKKEQTHSYAISRPGTRETIYTTDGNPQSMISEQESLLEKQVKVPCTRRIRSLKTEIPHYPHINQVKHSTLKEVVGIKL